MCSARKNLYEFSWNRNSQHSKWSFGPHLIMQHLRRRWGVSKMNDGSEPNLRTISLWWAWHPHERPELNDAVAWRPIENAHRVLYTHFLLLCVRSRTLVCEHVYACIDAPLAWDGHSIIPQENIFLRRAFYLRSAGPAAKKKRYAGPDIIYRANKHFRR